MPLVTNLLSLWRQLNALNNEPNIVNRCIDADLTMLR